MAVGSTQHYLQSVFDMGKSALKRGISITAPLMIKVAINKYIEEYRFSFFCCEEYRKKDLLKEALILVTRSVQWTYDSYRLKKFSDENYGTTAEGNKELGVARCVGLMASGIMLVWGAVNVISAVKHLNAWNNYPIVV